MGEKIASLYAEVTAKTDQATDGIRNVKGELQDAGGSFSDLAAISTAAMAAIAVGAGVMKQAFDFGEAGAQVLSTRSAFDSLLASVGQGPGMLAELQAATRGTVSELALMSSTNTLLIGTSGALGAALAAAAPQLAAIAQAAHQINPALGETSFLYDSLAKGIKRAQPEILDNLGLNIKLETVYREFAESLGKATEALTAEEKSMAVLNAVLADGTRLVDQAGKANAEASVKIDRMQASLENTSNAIKAQFAPMMADAADAVYYLLEAENILSAALDEHGKEVAQTAGSYEEYRTEMERAAAAVGNSVNANGDLVLSLVTVGDGAEKVVKSNYMLSESEFLLASSGISAADGQALLAGGLSQLDTAAQAAGAAVAELDAGVQAQASSWDAYGERMTAVANEAMGMMQIATVALAAGIRGELGDALADYSETLTELQLQEVEMTAQMAALAEQGFGATSTEVMGLTAALAENQAAQQTALADLQATTSAMIYQQAAAGLDAQASLDLARAMNVLSESDWAVASAIEALRVQYDANADGAISAAEGAAEYARAVEASSRAVQSLQSKNMPVTLENIATEMEALAASEAGGELQTTAAAAGEAAPSLEDVAAAATDVAQAVDDVADGTEDQNRALDAVQGAGTKAAAGLTTLKGKLVEVKAPLQTAAQLAKDLGQALNAVNGNLKVNVTTSGFPAAINWINDLKNALNSIPSSVSATVNLSSTGGSTAPPTVTPQAAAGQAVGGYVDQSVINVYDPLAATILAQQRRNRAAAAMEKVMNG